MRISDESLKIIAALARSEFKKLYAECGESLDFLKRVFSKTGAKYEMIKRLESRKYVAKQAIKAQRKNSANLI